MKKRTLALLLAAMMVLGLLAGCGGSSSAGGTEPAASSAEETEAAPAEEAEEAAPADDTEEAAPAEAEDAGEDAGSAEDGEEASAPEEKGDFEAAPAENLPLADGEKLTYYVELPGYMSMFNVNSYDDLEVWQYAEELLGVDVDFTIVNMESQDTNFQLMIASGDILDLVSGATQQYASTEQMIEDGVAIDLMEYQDQLPNYWKALDYYEDYKTVAINQDGIMPEVITISDD